MIDSFPELQSKQSKRSSRAMESLHRNVDRSKEVKKNLEHVERGAHNLLKGVSVGRHELPGDLIWYTQDKGLRSYEELKSRVSNWLYWDISDTADLKSRVSNWGLQVKTYRLIYATDETCERNETRGSCLKWKYPKMVWTDLERSRQVQSGPGWSRRVWKVCGLGGQILTAY